MQVQTISNTKSNNQNFQGNVVIVNELSYNPCKYVRKAMGAMQEMIKDKPYDLFIKQHYKENEVSLTAQDSINYLKNKGLKSEAFVSSGENITDEFYKVMSELVIKDMDSKLAAQPASLAQRFGKLCKRCADNVAEIFEKNVKFK